MWIDLIACLPFDYLFELGLQTTNPCLRFNRLIRLQRVFKFTNTTEMWWGIFEKFLKFFENFWKNFFWKFFQNFDHNESDPNLNKKLNFFFDF